MIPLLKLNQIAGRLSQCIWQSQINLSELNASRTFKRRIAQQSETVLQWIQRNEAERWACASVTRRSKPVITQFYLCLFLLHLASDHVTHRLFHCINCGPNKIMKKLNYSHSRPACFDKSGIEWFYWFCGGRVVSFHSNALSLHTCA